MSLSHGIQKYRDTAKKTAKKTAVKEDVAVSKSAKDAASAAAEVAQQKAAAKLAATAQARSKKDETSRVMKPNLGKSKVSDHKVSTANKLADARAAVENEEEVIDIFLNTVTPILQQSAAEFDR
ncbi:MAG: hypothetical protein EOP09_14570, partial [Proteobacteria bacterium]